MNFSTPIAFISSTKQPRQQICSLLKVFNILSHQGFRKVHKNCRKFSKFDIFCIFVSFGLKLMHFFKTNSFYLFKKASTTTHWFLFERLEHSKPPSLSKSTQKLHKSFKNLNFHVLCQFRFKFDAFFQHKLLLSLQGSLPDNEFFPCLTSLTF